MTGAGTAALGALRSGLGALLDLVLPTTCSACRADDISVGGLCDACSVKLLALASLHYCPRCGTTIGPNIPVRDDGCSACPSPLPRFASVTRLGPYAPPLRRIVQGLKYRRVETMYRHLGRMLALALTARHGADVFDLILPVPMHWRRRLGRGCDHARGLARAVSSHLNVPVGDQLIRIRHTPAQVHLPRTRRIANVRGAFSVARPADIEGARILLVDDVTTTGATAGEAARTIIRGGGSSVHLAVVAKAEPPRAYTEHLPTGA